MANKILVAEDNVPVRETFAAMYEYYCTNELVILQVGTKEEALAVINSADGPQVVVTDLRMPNFGDGEAVAIAAQDKGIKVIVLSTSVEDLSETVRGNCFAVFVKSNKNGLLKEVATKIDEAIAA